MVDRSGGQQDREIARARGWKERGTSLGWVQKGREGGGREGDRYASKYIVMRSCTTILQKLERTREWLLTDGQLTLGVRRRKNFILLFYLNT